MYLKDNARKAKNNNYLYVSFFYNASSKKTVNIEKPKESMGSLVLILFPYVTLYNNPY